MAINGALKFLVLKIISEQEKNGSLIVSEIEEKIHWKVSPGSFYPLMQDLADRGLVEFQKDANVKIYSITSKGKEFLKGVGQKREEIFKKIEEAVNLLGVLGDKESLGGFLNQLNSCPIKFIPIHDSLEDFSKIISSLNISKNAELISEILDEAVEKLRKLK